MNVRSFLTVWFTLAAFPAAACQVSSNLVLNCGFDTDLAHWSVAAGSCAHDDAAGVSKLGSARCESATLAPGAHQMKIRQCASSAAAGQYALGAYARRDSGSGVACAVDVEAHADASCNDKARVDSARLVPQPNAFTRSAPRDLALPANTRAVSIEVVCESANAFSVLLDDVLFGADLIFANGFEFAAPVLSAGATLDYTENDSASVIDNTVTVSDVDSANLASATVSISANFQSGTDVLACGSCGTIVPVYTPASGVLTLTGSATLAAYQTALRSVTFQHTSEDPNQLTRTITWVANDGNAISSPVTSSVTVSAVNDLPVLTAGATFAYTENQAATAIDATLTVSDTDSANLGSATVSISANFQTAEDILACGSCGSIVPVYTAATGVLTLTGAATPAAYQAALRSVTYRNSSENPSGAARTITWVGNDGINDSVAVLSTVNVTPVNDAPVGVVPAGSPFAITGNVRRSIAAGTLLAGATDAEGSTLTTQLSGVPTNGATVVVNTDGSFTYNPGAGYEGSASFQFEVCDAAPLCSTPLTVGVSIAGMIWFIDDSAGAGSGRLSDPMNSIATFAAVNNGTGNNPAANDNIFLYNGTYTGTFTLLNGQRLLGEGMSITLSAATGITPPAGSDALPTTVLANRPAWTSSGTTLTLGSGNTIRGFNIANSATTKIAGTNFGTLTVNEIALSGTGQALSLTTGAFSGSSAFDSIATTSSGTQGLSFTGITGGALIIGSTVVSGSTTQGILVGTTQANIAFGNTTVAAGTDGVSLQNNSAGTRSFGSLAITNGSGAGFLHAVGGGATTVGATTITNPGGSGISIASSTTAVTFGNTSITQSGGSGVDLSTNSGAVTFADLDITPDTGQRALFSSGNTGTITSTSGTIIASNASGAVAISGPSAASRTPLALVLDSISVSNDTVVGINIGLVSGNLTVGTTTIAGGGFVGVQVLTTAAGATMNFGNTSVTGANSVAGVRLGIPGQGNAGNITFADLDIAPSNGHPGLIGIENTGTITSTSGTLNAASASAVQIVGVSTATRTPLAMVLTSVSSSGGANNIALTNVSGSFAMNAGALSSATGAAFTMTGSTATVTYSGSVTSTTAGISLTSNTGGTMTFRGGLGLSTGANPAFTATGGGTINVCDENPCAPGATGALVNTLTTTTGTALNVSSTAIGANNLEFRSISSNGGTGVGIYLENTGSSGGLKVVGDGSNTSVGGNSSGGTIANKSGTDGSTTSGIGIYLNNVSNVVLRRMTIIGTNQNFGIRGYRVNNFTLEYATVNGTNGDHPSFDNYGEGSVMFGDDASTVFNGMTGVGTVTNCLFAGGRARNFSVVNTAGTLNRLTIAGSTFGLNQNGNSSLAVEARNAGTIANVTVTGSNFTGSPGDAANFTGQTGTTMDVVFGGVTATRGVAPGNTITNNHPNNNIGGSNLTFATQGVMNFHCLGNTMRDANGSAVTFFKASAATIMNGYFDNNEIGNSAVVNSGSASGNGIFVSAGGTGTMSYTITNNLIHRIAGNGHIYADNTGGSYVANFTIQGNTFDLPGASEAFAIGMTNGSPGSSDTVNVCADIGGSTVAEKNTINFNPALGVVVGSSGVNNSVTHTFTLPGLSASTEVAVEGFIQSNNTGAFTTDAYADAPATFGAFKGTGTTCPTPSSIQPE